MTCSWKPAGPVQARATEVVHAVDVQNQGVDKQGWHGEARDAFEKHWEEQKRFIKDVAHNFHQVADGLRAYADQIHGERRRRRCGGRAHG